MSNLTYYFDASRGGPTDSSANWTDDANAFDGSISTFARSASSTGTLDAWGTTAPTTGSDVIRSVRVRIYGRLVSARVYEDNAGSPGTQLAATNVASGPNWTNPYLLDIPTGGWTWDKISKLHVGLTASSTNCDAYIIEIIVAVNVPTVENHTTADSGGATQTSLTIPEPTGIVANEVLVAIGMSDTDGADGNNLSTTETGWTKIAEVGSGDSDCAVAAWYKVAAGSDGSFTFDCTDSDELIGWYLRISNVDTSDPTGGTSSQLWASFLSLPMKTTASPFVGTELETAMVICALATDGSDAVTDGGTTLTDGSAHGQDFEEVSRLDPEQGGNDVGGIVGFFIEHDPSNPAGGSLSYTTTTGDGRSLLNFIIHAQAPAAELECTAGSFTLSGQTADLNRKYSMDASAGSFALSGQAADFTTGYAIEVDTGSFALTGSDATLTHEIGTELDAEAGSFALSGVANAFKRGYVLECDAGSFAHSGQDATLTHDTGAEAITLSASTHITAGGENTTAQLTPPSGKTTGDFGGGRIADDENPSDAVDVGDNQYREDEWSLVALPASVYGATYEFRILVDGVPVTSAVTPQWIIDAHVNGEAGAFTLTGSDADFTIGYQLHCDAGSFSVSGISADLNRNYIFEADAGAFTLTGANANGLRALVVGISGTHETFTYYFDASSSGPTDPNFAWSDDANAFDGSILTVATALGAGTVDWLSGTGTTAPADGNTIERVFWRAYCRSNGTNRPDFRIYEDGGVDLLGGGLVVQPSLGWSVSQEMAAEPTAGWTWSALKTLEMWVRPVISGSGAEVARVEIQVDVPNNISFEITGINADLFHSGLLEGNAGSFALTGQDATLTHSYLLNAETGAFNLSGQTTEFIRDANLDAETGSFTLSGVDADLLRGYVIETDAGSFVLTGVDVDLLSGITMDAEAGSFLLSGQDADLDITLRLEAEAGSFLLTGINAELDLDGEFQADTGAFALAGADANLLKTFLFDAETGSFALSGSDTDLTTAFILQAELGSFTLSGQAADLTYGANLGAETGAFNLTGVANAFSREYNLAGEAGSYILTGISTDLEKHYSVSFDAGTIALTGADVAFDSGLKLVAETGSFVLSGQSADLDLTVASNGVEATGNVTPISVKANANTSAIGLAAAAAVGAVSVGISVTVAVVGLAATAFVGDVEASGDANIAPVGVEATSEVGSVTVSTGTSIVVEPTGLEGTEGIGSVSVVGNAVIPATGVEATPDVGSVEILGSADVQPAGVEATSGVDSVIVTGKAVVVPTGVFGTTAIGAVTIIAGNEISVGVSGVQGAGQVESVEIIGDATIPTTGVSATGEVGSVEISLPRVAEVTGVETAAYPGSVSIDGQAIVQPDGVEAAAQIGSVSITTEGNVTVILNGIFATGEIGSSIVIGDANIQLSGVGSNSGVGSVTIDIDGSADAPVTGVSGTGGVGEAGVTGDANIALTGLEGSGQVGAVSVTEGSSADVPVTGVESVGSVGEATVTGQANILLTGVGSLGEIGAVTVQAEANVTVVVSGVEGIGQVGEIEDQDSASTTILKAMLANLGSIVLTPALPIAWPGIPMEPPSSGMWLEARFFPNETRDLVWNNHARVQVKGYLQVSVYWRSTEGSLLAASRVADEIVDGFPKGLEVGPARIKKTPWTSSALYLEDKNLIPVIIPYMGIVPVSGYDGVVTSSGSKTTNIIEDLLARLDTLSTSPALPVAWPGVQMTPPESGIWLEANFAPTESTDLVWDDDTQKNTTGSLVVKVYYRPGVGVGQSSLVAASEVADKIIRLFPKGLGVGAVRILKVPSQGPAIDMDDKSYIPVTIPFSGIVEVLT